jgi:hypothetical protein
MIMWKYEEPHCYCCGANLPFSEIDNREISSGRILESEGIDTADFEDSMIQDNNSSIVFDDILLWLARALMRR